MTSSASPHELHLDRLQDAYTRILGEQRYDGVLLYSGQPSYHFADDLTRSFKSFAHFLHWVPLPDTAHSWLLIRPGQPPRLWFHAPVDYWHLPATLPEAAWSQRFDIVAMPTPRLPELPAGRFAVMGEIGPEDAARLGGDLNPPRLQAALDELRMFKSDHEIACMRRASAHAAQGHQAAREAFTAGGAELDIHLAYLKASRQRETDTPYPGIIGCNAHAGVLHYQHYATTPPQSPYSLLVDAGCSFAGYAADITRTWPGTAATTLFKQLISAIEAYQRQLVDAAVADVDFVALHLLMHERLAATLMALGIVREMSVEACVATGITRAFCPHGLGHSLGLQTHDVAGLQQDASGTRRAPPAKDPALRLTRRLQPGMVVTIEPGCYVIDSLLAPLRSSAVGRHLDWTAIDSLRPHGGIRIEDNIVITPQGNENLTRTPASGL